ncbi:hypothetical protein METBISCDRAFT_29766 [Metschnikowia bicuspidata]|uniref:PAS domain-containing protein n=1 Tax=Metschnikowia bicuspidata TaxID=27322 RepID=A0A4P9ZGE3_9ASCO|nr:hypothetical protein METBISCDRAFT_29766 [Metschnikowia bicuspidata]
MTKRLDPGDKKARKSTLRACTFCHSKHLQCLNFRPCVNCVKRKIAHQCVDMTRKKAKYMSANTSPNQGMQRTQNLNTSQTQEDILVASTQSLSQDLSHNINVNMNMNISHSIGSLKELKDSTASTPSTTATAGTSTTAIFDSNFLSQEYKMLGDLISKPSLPSSLDYSAQALAMEQDASHSRPFISLDTKDKNGELFKEQQEQSKPQYLSPLASHHIYQTVQDIYSNPVINFDYPQSYHSLTYFLRNRFTVTDKDTEAERAAKRKNFLIILKLIASYRPTFISLHNSLLQPYDIHFLEMSFQRCLLDYENLSRLNASPTIIWRRTGEIVSISNDLVNLLGLSTSEILSKRTFIMELMYDDASIVEYFRLFKSVAVGNLHLTIVTKCKLIKRDSGAKIAQTNTNIGDLGFIEFCSVWTVKRDLFDLPMVIVGQFLPVLSSNGGIRTY